MHAKSIIPSFKSKASFRRYRSRRNLRLEQLETRELMSISSPAVTPVMQNPDATPRIASLVGQNSAQVNVTDYKINIERDIPLFAPSNLRASEIRSTALTLSWNDNSINERGFNIQVRQGNSSIWTNIGSMGPDTTGCVVYGMLPQNTYSFRVNAWNKFQTSGYSNTTTETTRCPNYAVLFSGGINASSNNDRYYNNIKSLYQTITIYGNVAPENVYVVFADGTNKAADRPGNINSDMRFASSSHVVSATQANLLNTLTTLAGLVTSSDNFLFYSFDHGSGAVNSPGTTGEEALCGWGEDIADNVLAPALQGIHSAHSAYVFAECFSGGMLDDLMPVGRTNYGCAATNHYEYSWGDGFAAGFVAALQVGKQTTTDIYKYAVKQDPYAVTTPYTANAGTYTLNKEHPWQTGTDFTLFQPQVYINSASVPPGTEFPTTTGKQNSNNANCPNASLANAIQQILTTNWTTTVTGTNSIGRNAQAANNPPSAYTRANDTVYATNAFSGGAHAGLDRP